MANLVVYYNNGYWLIIEMPVLVKIKHEELYDYWKYPNANASKSKPTLWRNK